ncbi:uncharacterized protein AKAW2_50054S [Aspergillus luchuensis]|uniref:LIM domain protein n=1 Tax=Aspergillus kawachii TaxID=1069201 RepID=A0A146G291_ASPKA|nr:uncharacterized protein AKAW2_50054S [Aspergillus luchuensis]BCR99712.1 hypothetical protein AKAW2_50054S [Aspergillus luchuensis]GAT31023.1 LIM domain protein [Aspergillus luchuensis]
MARGIFVTGTDGITTFLVQQQLLRFASPVTPGLSSPHHWANDHQLRFQGSAELSMPVHPLNWMSSRLFPLVARHLVWKIGQRDLARKCFKLASLQSTTKVVSPPLVIMGPTSSVSSIGLGLQSTWLLNHWYLLITSLGCDACSSPLDMQRVVAGADRRARLNVEG